MASAIELQTLPHHLSTEPSVEDSVPKNDILPPHSDPTPSALPHLKQHVLRERLQLCALYWCMFLAGWNDGTAGPLIPRIQRVYHVGRAMGFIGGATINVPLTDKLGFGKTTSHRFFKKDDHTGCVFPLASWPHVLTLQGALCQIIAYAMQAPAPPFPVFVLSFVINGVGMAIQDAQANGYVASLKNNSEIKMGLLHGAYGAGALASPLVATQFSQLHHWSFHYLVSLGVAISNVILLLAVFRLKTQDECLASVGEAAGETGTSQHSKFRQILSLKTVHLLAFFILIYVGVEVTIGGWIVTYIIDVRGGGPSSGYVSAGFFGGLMTGRVALLWINHKIGERRVLYLYSVLAIVLELVVWLVPSLIGSAVAVSLVGVLLAGSAIFPFLTGAIASKTGIKALQPLLISMMSFMLILWALVPGAPRRVD
ncbi:major facilitator superfamily domain-containing protein [Mycena sp. CBHHK59/15]|nr:major facilitator superfamily domain-containing protein [Mycena sp. CBHHK59/15]